MYARPKRSHHRPPTKPEHINIGLRFIAIEDETNLFTIHMYIGLVNEYSTENFKYKASMPGRKDMKPHSRRTARMSFAVVCEETIH